MKVVAWKYEKDEESVTYRVQINWQRGEITKKKITDAMKGWIHAGEGLGVKRCLIFSKKFDTIQEWKSWLKDFPFEVEVKRS